MDGHRRAARGIVGGHEAAATGLGDAFHEGVGIVFAQLPLREVRREIMAPVLITVGDEMLQHAGGAPVFRIRSLGAAHIGLRHLGDQVRVFAVALFRAAPAGVAPQVDVRAPDDQAAAVERRVLEVVALLDRDLLRHPLHQFRVPGLRQAIGLREGGRRQRRVDVAPGRRSAVRDAVHAFRIIGNRHAQPRDAHVDREQVDFFVQGQVGRDDAGGLCEGAEYRQEEAGQGRKDAEKSGHNGIIMLSVFQR